MGDRVKRHNPGPLSKILKILGHWSWRPRVSYSGIVGLRVMGMFEERFMYIVMLWSELERPYRPQDPRHGSRRMRVMMKKKKNMRVPTGPG